MLRWSVCLPSSPNASLIVVASHWYAAREEGARFFGTSPLDLHCERTS